MDLQFGPGMRRGIGDRANQRSGLEVMSRPGSEHSEDGLGRVVAEFLHDRVVVDSPGHLLDGAITA
jgi:hypothetical protein